MGKFKVGDVVRLKSGGESITVSGEDKIVVINLAPNQRENKNQNSEIQLDVKCYYWEGKKLKEKSFDENML